MGHKSDRLGGPVPSGFHAASSQEVQRTSSKGFWDLDFEADPSSRWSVFLSTLKPIKLTKRKH